MQSLRIVVADDERDVRDYLADMLPDMGHEVAGVAKSGEELLQLGREKKPDLIVTDIRMPDGDGLTVVKQLTKEFFCPVVMITAFHDKETLKEAADSHVFAYLVKPIEKDQLESAIAIAWKRALQFRSVCKEAANLKQALDDRKLIEQAKGILMKQGDMQEEESFRRLRQMARDQQKKISDVAQMVIATHQLLKP